MAFSCSHLLLFEEVVS
jgi:hypothetical protein